MKLRRSGWTWFLDDPAVLEPWSGHIPELMQNPVKHSGLRTVFKTRNASGTDYFVKIEEKRGLIARFRNFFCSKAESEFRSGHLLKQRGIPCAEYDAWGYNSRGSSILVSRALNGYESAMKFWYSAARFDDVLRDRWIDLFFDLSLRFRRNHLVHPDFHSGNVMLVPETLEFALIDPFGIREKRNFGIADQRALLAWLLPLRMDMPVSVLAERLASSGLIEGDADSFLREMIRRSELRLEKEWEHRRKKQILTGNSKFSHTEGNREFRHTLWYEPSDVFEKEELACEEFTAADAEKLWLDSFREQLFCRKPEKIPLILEKKGKKTLVFSISCKKNSYFC